MLAPICLSFSVEKPLLDPCAGSIQINGDQGTAGEWFGGLSTSIDRRKNKESQTTLARLVAKTKHASEAESAVPKKVSHFDCDFNQTVENCSMVNTKLLPQGNDVDQLSGSDR